MKDATFYAISVTRTARKMKFQSFLGAEISKSTAMQKAANFLRENPKATARLHLCDAPLEWFTATVSGMDDTDILQLALTLADGHRPIVVRRV